MSLEISVSVSGGYRDSCYCFFAILLIGAKVNRGLIKFYLLVNSFMFLCWFVGGEKFQKIHGNL